MLSAKPHVRHAVTHGAMSPPHHRAMLASLVTACVVASALVALAPVGAAPIVCLIDCRSPTTTVSQPTHATITLGDPVADVATVTPANPEDSTTITGTVEFFICSPDSGGCSTGGYDMGAFPLSGGQATTGDLTLGTPGINCFRAVFNGNEGYASSTDAGENECVDVLAPTTTVTVLSRSTITLGDTVSDTAYVNATNSDLGGVKGTVEFFLCSPDSHGCPTGGYDIGGFALDNGTANTGEIRPGEAGLYCFRAEYQGTTAWGPSQDSAANECVDVVAPQQETQTATTPSATQIPLGDMVNDTAYVTPVQAQGPVTGGTVEFFVCSPDSAPCPTGGYDIGGFPLVDGMANSGDIRPSLPGLYCFRAEYSGSEGWLPSQEDGEKECVNVMAPTSTTTTPNRTAVEVGATVTDHAVVASTNPDVAGPVEGSVAFFVCAQGVVPCTSGGTAVSTDALAGGEATSSAAGPFLEPGTYCFRAEYPGNLGWAASQDASGGECFDVQVAREASQTVTTPSSGTVALGDNVTDHAHVSALVEVGDTHGTVTFYVCAEGVVPCTSGGTLLGTVALDADGNATSPAFTPTEPGTYCFRGEFNGNTEYLASTDASRDECFTVSAKVPFFPTTGALVLAVVGSLAGAWIVVRRRA